MNKKVLLFLVLILLIAAVTVIVAYKYQKKEPATQEPIISVPEVQIETEEGGIAGLTICSDKCGDGACQKEDLKCNEEGNNLNCTCPETPQECPQDCK